MNPTEVKKALKMKRYAISIIDEDIESKKSQLSKAQGQEQKDYINSLIEVLQEVRKQNMILLNYKGEQNND